MIKPPDHNAWTHTASGKALDLRNPRKEDMDKTEIFRALAFQCRYNGCVQQFYSVAEHSCAIAAWLLHETDDAKLALEGLLHDVAKAYLGDLTYPLQQVLWGHDPTKDTDWEDAGKVVLARYKAAQSAIDTQILELLGHSDLDLHNPRVREADFRILLDEANQVLSGSIERPQLAQLEPLGVTLPLCGPDEALVRFTQMFEVLTKLKQEQLCGMFEVLTKLKQEQLCGGA